MLPYLDLRFLGFTAPVATSVALFVLGLVLVTAALIARSPAREGWKAPVLVAIVAATGLVGGRLMHVYWERPEFFAEHPELIFGRFDGLTFYGAFFAAVAAAALAVPALYRGPSQARSRARAWDGLALSSAFL